MRLTIDDVSRFLNVPVSTVSRWVRQGRIPVEIVDDMPVFSRLTLEKWAKQNSIRFCVSGDGHDCQLPLDPGSGAAAMARGGVYPDIDAVDIPSVLHTAVNALTFPVPDSLYEKLLDRESMASTGIGKGVAIPHTRQPLEGTGQDAVIATFFLKSPIDYKAVDGVPVFVLFLLITPSAPVHLHLLSRLAFCIREDAFISFLRTRPEAGDLYARVARLEETLEQAKR